MSPVGGPYLSPLVRGMALLLGAGASFGIAIWELVFGDQMVAYVRSNQIEPATRKLLFLFGGLGLAVPCSRYRGLLVVPPDSALRQGRTSSSRSDGGSRRCAWRSSFRRSFDGKSGRGSTFSSSSSSRSAPLPPRSCSIGHLPNRRSSARPPGPSPRSANAAVTRSIAGRRGCPGSS